MRNTPSIKRLPTNRMIVTTKKATCNEASVHEATSKTSRVGGFEARNERYQSCFKIKAMRRRGWNDNPIVLLKNRHKIVQLLLDCQTMIPPNILQKLAQFVLLVHRLDVDKFCLPKYPDNNTNSENWIFLLFLREFSWNTCQKCSANQLCDKTSQSDDGK